MKNFIMTLVCLALILGIACTVKEFYVERNSPAVSAEDDKYAHLHIELDNKKQPWNLILVNDFNEMPKTDITLKETAYGEKVDERILPFITKMFTDAENAGLKPEITSGHRTYDEQKDIFDTRIKEYRALGHSKKEATSLVYEYVAEPGFSEHETGLALDVNSSDGDSWELYIWLQNNCHKYGFIIRYPQGKEDITGIEYEPWHIRFVGEDAAAYIHEYDLTLEEYLIDKQ